VEHGEIVERGTHKDLLALNGRYKQLHDRQHGMELDQFINPGEDFTTLGANDIKPGQSGG
jgi:subfamily B ATP-binding cassette protein MsbA